MSDAGGPGRRWYRSLYWRIALGFVAFLAATLMAQGAFFLFARKVISLLALYSFLVLLELKLVQMIIVHLVAIYVACWIFGHWSSSLLLCTPA